MFQCAKRKRRMHCMTPLLVSVVVPLLLLLHWSCAASANQARKHSSPNYGIHSQLASRQALPPPPRRSFLTNPFPLIIVVALPEDGDADNLLRNPFLLSAPKARPVFDVAIEDITQKLKVFFSAFWVQKLGICAKILPPGSFRLVFENTRLSDAIGPQLIVDHYCDRSVDAVMGMPYEYLKKLSG